jgi:hypothetical protein
MWYHKKKKFLSEKSKLCDKLTDEEFEKTLRNIYENYENIESDLEKLFEIKMNNSNIPNEEQVLILKIMFYLIQRFNTFIMSPVTLQDNLTKDLNFPPSKSIILVNFYSEISRNIVTNIDSNSVASHNDGEEVLWNIKTTLSDSSNFKCKIPKANITIRNNSQEVILNDLDHAELSKLFDKIENIQSELDKLNE